MAKKVFQPIALAKYCDGILVNVCIGQGICIANPLLNITRGIFNYFSKFNQKLNMTLMILFVLRC